MPATSTAPRFRDPTAQTRYSTVMSPDQPPRQLPLVMSAPRGRARPPRHLADLDEPGRKALLEEMGLPGFRAKQLSHHYFARLVEDPAQMTDLPAGAREELVAVLLP